MWLRHCFRRWGSTNTAVGIGLAFRQFMALGQNEEGNGQFYFILEITENKEYQGSVGSD